jgi:probable rRNA maturation factor
MAEEEAASPVEVVIEDERWQAAGIETLALRAVTAGLVAVGRDPRAHALALLACNDARIAALNGDFRGKATPTNVLSWPAFDGPPPLPGEEGDDREEGDPLALGDIAIAYETCLREAEAGGISLADHATHLVLHGLLHLLGHDHEAEDDAEAMEKIETKTLASLGISDPYSAQGRH